jgi:hypothetical protein
MHGITRGAADSRLPKSKKQFAQRPGNPLSLEESSVERIFPYDKEWNGKVYVTKRVRPVFVEEAAEIVVVTVYTLLLLNRL